MNRTAPPVSIGLPVFNGENYLAAALDSLQAQTFADYELIISDNGSTDATQAICRSYAARDARISYHRVEENRGAAWNYNRTFELARGKYFKWAAHDDVCAPTMIERGVEALDRDPGVVVAYPRSHHIDAEGRPTQPYDLNLRTASPRPSDRFHDLVCISHLCYQVFGLIRSDALRRTILIGSFVSSDKVLLAQLALIGRFYEIPEYLFFPRRHPQQSVSANKARRVRILWFDPSKAGRLVLPSWRMLREYTLTIARAPIDAGEKLSCTRHLGAWVGDNWTIMAKDLALGAGHVAQPIIRPLLRAE